MGILEYALKAFQVLPTLLSAGQDIYGFVTETNTVIKTAQDTKGDISAEEWDKLNAKVDAIHLLFSKLE